MLKIPQNSFIFGVIFLSQVCAVLAAGRFDGLGGFEERSRHRRESQYYSSGYEDKERLRDRLTDVESLIGEVRAFNLRERKVEKRVLLLPSTSMQIHSAYASTIVPGLSPKMPPIFIGFSASDQRDLGTCAGFSPVDCLQAVHGRALSQADLIATAKRLDNCRNDGLPLGLAMAVAHRRGVVRYDAWPYDVYRAKVIAASPVVNSSTDLCMTPPVGIERETRYAFKSVESLFAVARSACVLGKPCAVDKVRFIRAALDKYRAPVSISIPVKMSDWQTGNITILSGKEDGWHAITVYGYDPVYDVFNFMNSWGTRWGYGGHGTITYAYIAQYTSEAWVGYGAKEIPPVKPAAPASKPVTSLVPTVAAAYHPMNELRVVRTRTPKTIIHYSRKNLKSFLGYLFRDYSDSTIAQDSGVVSASTIRCLRTDREYAADHDYRDVWKALKANFGSEYQKWRKRVIS